MAGTVKRLAGPAYIANSATNIYNPAANVYGLIKLIHIANVTAGAITYTLYIGATGGSAGGTEIAKAVSVPANSNVDWYPADLKLVAADFLSGLASAATSLVVTITGSEFAV
jgi:hypothetical protein